MGQQVHAERTVLVGGRYRLERLLGEGGMGVVHLATDEATGARVALKRLHAAAANDTRRTLFEREFHTLASLKHPRIVAVHEFGVDTDGAFYTMERLEGDDLSRAAPMPWREACGCLRDLASIIGVLHSRRLVHRDLSPRNLWRTPEGRLKLLDFGALSPFGVPTETVGTPPLTAPEALHREPLDARTDLFALGALGYWLLTGTHAFAARKMAHLPALWAHEPAPPSQLVGLTQGSDCVLPPELDALVLALLRVDPDERPRSTMEVIDTLNAVAQLPPESEEVVHRGYLDSNAFVGHRKPSASFEDALARTHGGRMGALWFEASRGLGRTRLLEELALRGRLSGATVLTPTVRDSGRSYALAVALADALLTALPEASRAAATPHASILGEVVPALRNQDDVPSDPGLDEAAGRRAQRLSALAGWIKSVARSHTLVLILDDLHLADEPSQSLLSTLASEEGPHRLLIVASAPILRRPGGVTALAMLRRHSNVVQLAPLSESEVHALLASCFGEVTNLPRLAARLHALTLGNPGHVLLIARHLVHLGTIQYAEGTWVLPFDLPDGLPESLEEGVVAQLAELSAPARRAARCLALAEAGWISPTVLQRLAEPGDSEQFESALAELTSSSLVRSAPEGLRLEQESVAHALRAELSVAERRTLHRRLAQHLASEAPEDASAWLRVGLQWLYAGDAEQARLPLLQALRQTLSGGQMANLRACAPGFERAHELLREAGAKQETMMPVLVALSVAGFMVDGTYAMRFGDETRRALDRTLRMGLQRSLRRFVGDKLALILTLFSVGLGLKLRRSPLRMAELVRWYVSVLSSLAGVAATYVDPKAIFRYADALEPFAALGPDHVAGFTHRYALAMGLTAEDKPTAALATLDDCLERLRSDAPIAGLAPSSRDFMVGGILFSTGVRQNFAVREEPLAMADKLEALSPIHAMQAEYLRSGYHLFRGQMGQADAHRKKLERMAIQLGSGWQAEATAPTQDLLAGLLTFDAARVKRAAQLMQHVVDHSPAVDQFQRYARGAYHLLRRRYDRALASFGEDNDEPRAVSGWARWRGLVAAAHNGRGDHERARSVCEQALAVMEPGDLDYVVITLDLQVELARAHAGLGSVDVGCRALDSLLQRYADRGPLILGYLHHARAKLALERGDEETCAQQLDAVEKLTAPLRIPSLRAEIASLRRSLRAARGPEANEAIDPAFGGKTPDRLQELMRAAGQQGSERGAVALQLVSELYSPVGSALLLPGRAELLACRGEPLAAEVLDWARDRLAACAEAGDTQTGDDLTATLNADVFLHEGVHCSLSLLWRPGFVDPAAALVLGFESEAALQWPSDGLRCALATQLTDTDGVSGE